MLEKHREQGNQIREALSALSTIQVEGDIYLKFSEVLDVTEDILYPDGLQTEEEYNRLMAISKAGCRTIGYSCEEITLLPPAVSLKERGTYLKKMPSITNEIIERIINQLLMQDSEFISSPYIIIKREKLASKLAHKHYQQAWNSLGKAEQEHLIRRGDEVAEKLGLKVRTFDSEPWLVGKELYVKAMTPDLDAWRETVSRVVGYRAYPSIDVVMTVGLHAAFNNSVDEDPEGVISPDQWGDLFDELGFTYNQEKKQLTPKPLNLSSDTTKTLEDAISSLPTYNHHKIGSFLIKDDLVQAAREALGTTITKGRLEQHITEGAIGRALIRLGYQLDTRWISRHELTMLPKKVTEGAEVFTLAMNVDLKMQTPAFADGFRIHSPALVRDERTLVYIELLGPRQAVKANWAALRQRNRSHYLKGVLSVNKEDRMTTLKTTLPCGWDHWCLIHRQASYDKLTPNEAFYLISHTPETTSPPSTFIAFLAKSLAIPILPEWAEHLWTEGRMKKLITPLSENCYGLGGWSIETHEWDQIVSEGLAQKQISF